MFSLSEFQDKCSPLVIGKVSLFGCIISNNVIMGLNDFIFYKLSLDEFIHEHNYQQECPGYMNKKFERFNFQGLGLSLGITSVL